jgi:tRNA A37 methylthiotransferase MiaB
MTPLRIYLADLTHIGKGVATEAFPLNIGLVASYARNLYGNEVDVSLYKIPTDLKEAITQRPPHILACSNYTWNCNLSYYFCELVKSIDPDIITVFGGTNYPFTEAEQHRFLSSHPALDIHTFYEGEQGFANIVERAMSSRGKGRLGQDPISGCQFISRGSEDFISGGPLPRIKELDAIPSPYVTGIMDKFFDGQLTPLVETARGCPFLCNFCNAGDRYFNKVNLFSDDYVREELTYIAKKAAQAGITHVTLADNNFGMIPRDATTAQVIYDLQKSFGWPRSMSAWTGKNSKERVIEVTRLLKETLSISMSVQSMDKNVLENIGRDNIKLDHYQKIAEELNHQGRPQHAEVILPLPGETLPSHIRGLNVFWTPV